MALGAHDPDRQIRSLKMLPDREVAIVLKKSQEADFRASLDAFEYHTIPQVFVPVVHIRRPPPNEHCVDEFLRGIPVLVDQCDAVHIHISCQFRYSLAQYSRVHQKNHTWTLLLNKAWKIEPHSV